MIKILFVCHGNICRSPMAEFILKNMVNKEGDVEEFEIASAATSREEIGNPVYPPAKRKLAEHGIMAAGKTARQMTRIDYEKYDYILAMDSQNIRNIQRIIGEDTEKKVYKLLEFAGEKGDIADPWYSGDFDTTYEDIVRGCSGLLQKL